MGLGQHPPSRSGSVPSEASGGVGPGGGTSPASTAHFRTPTDTGQVGEAPGGAQRDQAAGKDVGTVPSDAGRPPDAPPRGPGPRGPPARRQRPIESSGCSLCVEK